MALSFPTDPAEGQQYLAPNGMTYTYHQGHWHTGAAGREVAARITIAETPPTSATEGTFWWNSAEGLLYIRYHDGVSLKWVPATVGIAPVATGREVLLHTATVTLSAPVAAVDFLLSGYNKYLLVVDGAIGAMSAFMSCLLSADGGATWFATYEGTSFPLYGTNSPSAHATELPLGSNVTGSYQDVTGSYSTGPKFSGEFRFFHMEGGANPSMAGLGAYRTATAATNGTRFIPLAVAGRLNGSNAINALRIKYSTSVIMTGAFRLYGVRD
jgi:hypothetical protein